jgi:hypothetical protein
MGRRKASAEQPDETERQKLKRHVEESADILFNELVASKYSVNRAMDAAIDLLTRFQHLVRYIEVNPIEGDYREHFR